MPNDSAFHALSRSYAKWFGRMCVGRHIMKRTLIPKSTRDRLSVGMGFLMVGMTVLASIRGDRWWALSFGLFVILFFVDAYVVQDQVASSPDASEYSVVIEKIGVIGKQLSELSGFLEKERIRVADTEATIRKLNYEKTKLEPLVQTQREIVEAILSAHSERTAKQAWKERLFGFSLGVVASLIASFLFEYFKR